MLDMLDRMYEQFRRLLNLQDEILKETPQAREKEDEVNDTGVDKFIIQGEHDEDKEFFKTLEDLANVIRTEMQQRTNLIIEDVVINKEGEGDNTVYSVKIFWEKEVAGDSPIDPRRVPQG